MILALARLLLVVNENLLRTFELARQRATVGGEAPARRALEGIPFEGQWRGEGSAAIAEP